MRFRNSFSSAYDSLLGQLPIYSSDEECWIHLHQESATKWLQNSATGYASSTSDMAFSLLLR